MKYCLLFLFVAIGLASCKKDEVDAESKSVENAKSVQSLVTGVNGPTSGAVNQQLAFTLLWPNAGTQSYFHHLTATTPTDSTRLIKLFVATDTTTTKSERQSSAVFTFKAASAGTYYLKFAKPGSDSTYSITDTVVIR